MSASEFEVTDLGRLTCGAQECTRTRRYRVEMIGSPIKPVEVCQFHRDWAKRWLQERHAERIRRLDLCPLCGLDQLGSAYSCDCPGADIPVSHPYQRRGSWSADDWCAVDGCTSRPSAHKRRSAAQRDEGRE